MSYQDRLHAEINTKLDELSAMHRPWRASWIAHEICNEHSGGLAGGSDADFWRHGGYMTCRDAVRRCINMRAGDIAKRGDKRQQFTLPGFERDHLQDYYIVNRDGEEVGVCILDMTDAEIDQKAAFIRAMAATCYAHADELERFKGWRHNNTSFAA